MCLATACAEDEKKEGEPLLVAFSEKALEFCSGEGDAGRRKASWWLLQAQADYFTRHLAELGWAGRRERETAQAKTGQSRIRSAKPEVAKPLPATPSCWVQGTVRGWRLE